MRGDRGQINASGWRGYSRGDVRDSNVSFDARLTTTRSVRFSVETHEVRHRVMPPPYASKHLRCARASVCFAVGLVTLRSSCDELTPHTAFTPPECPMSFPEYPRASRAGPKFDLNPPQDNAEPGPSSVGIGPSLADSGPMLAEFEVHSKSVEFGPSSAEVGPCLLEFGQSFSNMSDAGQSLDEVGAILAEVGRIWAAELGRSCLASMDFAPESCQIRPKFGPNSTWVDQIGAELGQVWLRTGQSGADVAGIWAEFDQVAASFGSQLTKIGPMSAEAWGNSIDVGTAKCDTFWPELDRYDMNFDQARQKSAQSRNDVGLVLVEIERNWRECANERGAQDTLARSGTCRPPLPPGKVAEHRLGPERHVTAGNEPEAVPKSGKAKRGESCGRSRPRRMWPELAPQSRLPEPLQRALVHVMEPIFPVPGRSGQAAPWAAARTWPPATEIPAATPSVAARLRRPCAPWPTHGLRPPPGLRPPHAMQPPQVCRHPMDSGQPMGRGPPMRSGWRATRWLRPTRLRPVSALWAPGGPRPTYSLRVPMGRGHPGG